MGHLQGRVPWGHNRTTSCPTARGREARLLWGQAPAACAQMPNGDLEDNWPCRVVPLGRKSNLHTCMHYAGPRDGLAPATAPALHRQLSHTPAPVTAGPALRTAAPLPTAPSPDGEMGGLKFCRRERRTGSQSAAMHGERLGAQGLLNA